MFDPRIRMRHLHCFLETARRGSLSAAAETLSVSQPAASKTIRELEEILEVALFDRSGRRLALTQAGKTFQRYVGAALVELGRAQDLVRERPVRRSRIAVGALPTAATVLLPHAALSLRKTAPECLLRVTTGPNWLLLSQLREGALDMVVGRMAAAQLMEGLSFRQLYSEPIAAIVRAGHPLAGAAADAATLGRYPLMLPPPGAVIAPLVQAYLHGIGLFDPQPAFENVGLAFGRKVVLSSDTIWFISAGVVHDELESGLLSGIRLNDDLLGGPVGVAMRNNAVMTDEQRHLLAALVEAAGHR
ncbi:LysR substrate-binding domain-containing protein [Martelella mediterranea]|uniref:Galactose-binding protein regulator n=1 Tax=Martelella mediterranea DSM 17316 TaxID=1122214 RepID=A0A1U9Z1M0_9HYPH|nr:LysR substrate-binding domain-containing protein [Martelella mediterranea]AQZ51583.1 Galactose-binding protein regulator [Martelella mediterranea DSM 17316]